MKVESFFNLFAVGFIVASYFATFRLFNIPIYDFALAFGCIGLFYSRSPKPTYAGLLFLLFWSYYLVICVIHSNANEALRMLFTLLSFYLGLTVSKSMNRKLLSITYSILAIVSLTFYFIDIIPKDPFTIGPFSSNGLYDHSRYSAFFHDPAKLAQFFYLPMSYFLGYFHYLAILLIILTKTRLGLLITIWLYARKIIGDHLSALSFVLVVSCVMIFLPFILEVALELTKLVRPEFETRRSFDGVRFLSFSILFDGIWNFGMIEVTGPGTKRLFLDPVPPHNTFLSTWLEIGFFGVLILLCACLSLLFTPSLSTFFLTILIVFSFLFFDVQNSRYVAFFIGLCTTTWKRN